MVDSWILILNKRFVLDLESASLRLPMIAPCIPTKEEVIACSIVWFRNCFTLSEDAVALQTINRLNSALQKRRQADRWIFQG